MAVCTVSSRGELFSEKDKICFSPPHRFSHTCSWRKDKNICYRMAVRSSYPHLNGGLDSIRSSADRLVEEREGGIEPV